MVRHNNNCGMHRVCCHKMANLPIKSVKWAFDFVSWQPTESQILQAFSYIQLEEKERIAKFMFKRDAKASLIGRLLIRKFISENSHLKYNEIVLKRDKNGKPFILNQEYKNKLKFNVSHHGRLVVLLGCTCDFEVGVDVMTTKHHEGKNLERFFRLMSRNFSENEWKVIMNTDSSEDVRILLFNRYWALKESYLKAVGSGLSVDLATVEFRLKSKFLEINKPVIDTELYVNGLKQMDWFFEETLLDTDHLVAVAYKADKVMDSSTFEFLKYDDIVQNAVPVLPETDLQFVKNFMIKEEEPH